jgi:eukaryotic-like serine/threonine-protein kinase
MLESGTLLQKRYEIIEIIGKGGMGAVYLARDQRLGNTIALKETFFNDRMMLAAFEREARLLAGLRHAALPKVMDHFAEEDGQFLVMEFIAGEDLQDLLDASTQAFQTEEVLQWADQILDALDFLHSQNPQIIHRDIKPQNLKLTSRNQVVLLDFGLAKSAGGNATTTTSGQSVFAYTPIYAPLEQIQGAGTDARSDIYSLGATLYHLLTGTKPVDALSRAADFLNGKPDPLAFVQELNPRIPPAVGEVIAQAMALNRDLRPATAIVMRKLLRDAAQASTEGAGSQEQTIMAQTKVFHTNAKAPSPPLTHGQATPKTSANEAQQAGTHKRPVTPKNTSPNRAAQSDWPTTPIWPVSAVESSVSGSSNRGKLIAAALVLIVIGVIFTYQLNSSSQPEANEINPTTPSMAEQERLRNQSNAGASTSTTANEGQYPGATPVAMPERVATQENTAQRVTEERPATAEPVATQTGTTQKAEQTETKQEPVKTETQQPQQTPQAAKPIEPARDEERRFSPREDERRPPPPHMRPPPPHGGPPPHERRRP